MLLRKEKGGASIGEHTWANDGDVTEVPDALGLELLAIRGGDFSHVEDAPAKPARKSAAKPKPDAGTETQGDTGDDGDGDGDPDADADADKN